MACEFEATAKTEDELMKKIAGARRQSTQHEDNAARRYAKSQESNQEVTNKLSKKCDHFD
ncbi:MAG: hypothetical protein OEY99_08170 [Aigarchaeota archaeon]|nr:hypothetical protein [Aigarchaeota archaeon]